MRLARESCERSAAIRDMAFMLASNTASGTDLAMKASPPASMAATRFSGVSVAVRKITGVHAHCRVASKARMWRTASKPFITGISMSISTRSGDCSRKRSTASAPLAAETGSCPIAASLAPKAARMARESSTNSTRITASLPLTDPSPC